MASLQLTKDIMVRNLITCDPHDSLSVARKLMKDHNIRHIPVVDTTTQEFKGVITQKTLLKEAFIIAHKFGMDDLEHQENKRKIEDYLNSDLETACPDTPLEEACAFFIATKHGCLPILEGLKLVGILTSADFVKLSMTLLQKD